ncbi:MAG: HD domain-containing protein, partial [Bacteroidales bacterium]|nr:HD domain-containing protein [Bacteroidales bacterium]
DSLILTTLLHDLCSAYHPSSAHIKGHGYRSVRILKEICGLDITHEESNAIRYHMHPNAKQTQGNLLAGVVSAADIFSASHGIVDRIYRLVG